MWDVVVIGAGIIGTSVAIELRRRGAEVLMLERAVPGAESSSAAAGMLAPQLEEASPGSAFDLGIAARSMFGDWVHFLEDAGKTAADYRRCGGIKLFTSEAARDVAFEERAWQRRRGLAIELLDEADLRQRIPGLADHFRCGLWYPDEAQVDPRKLMAVLSTVARSLGIKYRSSVSVTSVDAQSSRPRVTVHLSNESIIADRLVVAAGAWTSKINGLRLPSNAVHPVRGQMVAIELPIPMWDPYIWTGAAYVVPRTAGRLLVGATVEDAGYEKRVTVGGLKQLLDSLVHAIPSATAATVVETWCGLRPGTPDHLPLLGPLTDSVWIASGHYRNGILQAPVTARAIAQDMAGEPTEVDLTAFSPRRFGADVG
jgi:glycine oxidase